MLRGIEIARNYLGLQEVRDKSKLMNLFRTEAVNGDILIDPEITPWCAAFVNACERSVGHKGTGKLNARSFLPYGEHVAPAQAKEGDIVIFERGNDGYSGHIAYFVRWDEDNNLVEVLGGNQQNRVCYAHYIKDKILGIRRSL